MSWHSASIIFPIAAALSLPLPKMQPIVPSPASADHYLVAELHPGETASDLVFRIIAISGPGIEETVSRSGGTGTYTMLASGTEGVIPWSCSFRMEGSVGQDDAKGEYRDHGRTMCFNGKCSALTDASGPFFNPTFWGEPKGALKPGMSWKVHLTQAWELGPAGEQTVTVLAVDRATDTVVLQREGNGDGSYRGAKDGVLVKRGPAQLHAAVRRGHAHWLGKAVFRHGIVVSDELLCDTAIELSSPELGTIAGRERQYMSVVEHPAPIEF